MKYNINTTESPHFDVVDGMLYHQDHSLPGHLYLVAPQEVTRSALQEACSRTFTGNILEKKALDRLKRQIRLRGM